MIHAASSVPWPLFLITFACTAACVAFLMPVLRRHTMDSPNERSSHATPVPRAGGIGVLIGLAAGLAFAGPGTATTLSGSAWAGLAILAVTGLIDDVRTLRSRTRLAVQVSVGAVVSLPVLDGSVAGVVTHLAVVVLIVGFVNAFNFMDGINGISAITLLVAGMWAVWLEAWKTAGTRGEMGWLLIGAALGFLLWNGAGKVFLGDVGSYLLGGLLAFLALEGVRMGTPWFFAAAPLALYVADTSWTLVHRTLQGHRVGAAHREHVYQRLTQNGLSHLTVSAIVLAFELGMCIAAWVFRDMGLIVIAAWTLLALIYASLPKWLGGRRAALA